MKVLTALLLGAVASASLIPHDGDGTPSNASMAKGMVRAHAEEKYAKLSNTRLRRRQGTGALQYHQYDVSTEHWVQNPFTGFVPSARHSTEFPHTMELVHLPLRSVMTDPGTFDWATLESLLATVAERSHHSIVRFWLDYPGQSSGLPEFLKGRIFFSAYDAHDNCEDCSVVPNYQDQGLHDALNEFAVAFGAQYGDDQRIAAVQIGLLGFWGDWQNWPLVQEDMDQVNLEATGEQQFTLVKTFHDSLPNYPVQMVLGATTKEMFATVDAPWKNELQNDIHVGFVDSTVGFLNYEDFAEGALASTGTTTRWQTSMMGGEVFLANQWCLFTEVGCDGGVDSFEVQAYQWHLSYVMNNHAFECRLTEQECTETDIATSKCCSEEYFARARMEASRIGYKFAVNALEVYETESDTLYFAVEVENIGTAPFYYDLKMVLVDGSNSAEYELPYDVSALQPFSPSVYRFELLDHNLQDQQLFKIKLVSSKVLDGQFISFANVDTDYQDGSMRLSLPPGDFGEVPAIETDEGLNLIENPSFESSGDGWLAFGSGFTIDVQTPAASGVASARCVSNSEDSVLGLYQEIRVTGQGVTAFVMSGWSKAEEVSGAVDGISYSIYADVQLGNGTNVYGKNVPFSTGSHDWEFRSLVVDLEAEISVIRLYLLFRGKSGTVWFDNVQAYVGTTEPKFKTFPEADEPTVFPSEEGPPMPGESDPFRSSENLLASPGFEEGGRWKRDYGEGFERSNEAARSGSWSAKMSADSTDREFVALQLVTMPMNSYDAHLSGFTKSSAVSGIKNELQYALVMDFLFVDATWSRGHAVAIETGTHDWLRSAVEVHFDKPISTVYVYLMFTGKIGTVYFDDLVLSTGPHESPPANPDNPTTTTTTTTTTSTGTRTPNPIDPSVTSPANMVIDPSFENKDSAWSDSFGNGFEYDDQDSNGGLWSARMTNTNLAEVRAALQYVTFPPNVKSFEASAWSKTLTVSGSKNNDFSLYVDVQLEDETWSYGHIVPMNVGTHDWQRVSVSGTFDQNIAQVFVYCLFRKHTGTVWFDDIIVVDPNYGDIPDVPDPDPTTSTTTTLQPTATTTATPTTQTPTATSTTTSTTRTAEPMDPDVTSPDNMVEDGSFEDGSDVWDRTFGDGFSRSASHSRSGLYSAYFTAATASETGAALQKIVVSTAGMRSLTASLWSKASNVSGSANNDYSLYLDVLLDGGVWSYGHIARYSTGTHDWEQAALELSFNAPVKEIWVYALFRNHSGTAWFDDVVVVDTTDYSPTTTPTTSSSTPTPTTPTQPPTSTSTTTTPTSTSSPVDPEVVAPSNMIYDGSFEDNSQLWDGSFGDGFSRTASEFRSGANAAAISFDTTSETGAALQKVTVSKSGLRSFRASMWSKASNVSGSKNNDYSLYIDVLLAGNTWSYGHIASYNTGNHDWEQAVVDRTFDSDVIEIWVYVLFRNHSGSAFFDDVIVVDTTSYPTTLNPSFSGTSTTTPTGPVSTSVNPGPISTTGNVLRDPGFEMPLGDSDWMYSYGSGFTRSEATPRSGSYAARIGHGNDGFKGAVTLYINAPYETTSFRFGGYSRASGVEGDEDAYAYGLRADVQFMDGTWSSGHSVAFSTGSHDYEAKEITVSVAKPIKGVYISAVFDDRKGTVDFDDLVFAWTS
eukprot:Clim_evm51s146 gene=Clim_evmTU51s146